MNRSEHRLTHDVVVRNGSGQTLHSGQVRLFEPGTPPDAFAIGHVIAVATGVVIGSGSGPTRWIYMLSDKAAFIPEDKARS